VGGAFQARDGGAAHRLDVCAAWIFRQERREHQQSAGLTGLVIQPAQPRLDIATVHRSMSLPVLLA
jgi:hypothetical protein